MESIEIPSLHDLDRAAGKFLTITRDFRRFAFYGPMGAGKTTLIKAICNRLGATDAVTSPTFSLVNEYHTPGGQLLYHFDLYRINSLNELYDIGYEEYFYSNSYLFIEWAEKAESLLPEHCVKVFLEEIGSKSRLVRISL